MEAVGNCDKLVLIEVQFEQALESPELSIRKLPQLVGMQVENLKVEA